MRAFGNLKRPVLRSHAMVELSGKSLEEEPLLTSPMLKDRSTSGKATAMTTGFGIFKSIVGGGVLTLP